MVDAAGGLITIGAAAVSAVVGAVTGHLITRVTLRRTSVKRFRYFPPPDEEALNEPFYDYFGKKLTRARKAIYLFGSGFESAEYASPASHRLINNYFNATRKALRNDIKFVRLQNQNNISREWADMLKALLAEFPHTFELRYLRWTIRTYSIFVSSTQISPNPVSWR